MKRGRPGGTRPMRRRAAVVVSVLVVRLVRTVARWFWHLNWKQKFYLFIILSCVITIITIAVQILMYVIGG